MALDDTEHIGNMWVDPHNPDVPPVAASDAPTRRASSAASSRPPTAARPGARFCIRTTSPAPSISCSAPEQPQDRLRHALGDITRNLAARGRPSKPPVSRASIRPPTAATPGRSSPKGRPPVPGPDRRGDGGGRREGLRDRGRRRLWRRRWRRRDCTAPMTAARTGAESTQDPRIQGSGYFSRVFLDPKNSNMVYVAQTSLYRSDDGGRTFASYKGAPGGDDNHASWIDPTDSDRMIMASDQGAHSAWTAANRGVPGTTSPPARSTISRRTPVTRIGSTGRSRTADRWGR